ncbi:AAEL006598-PA [Aedes aegypti]|uniref:AAEL006598-PA n=1 Tax=Aedes aegypti TaxID=7159 RepID=Q175P5_AEDAE|nr:AAEL006598-PA [Aedes aegypti]
MAKIVYLSLALLVTITSGQVVQLDDSYMNRVVGGQEAADGSVPYQVSLQLKGYGHICGGSIIGERWILTAAHCVEGETPGQLNVLAGTNSLKEGGELHETDKFIRHKYYNQPQFHNDVALIRLKSKLQFSAKVKPIVYWEKEVGANQSVVLTGWGRTSAGGPVPTKLQTLDLKTISNEECKQKSSGNSNNVGIGHICTLTKSGEGACNGDSGGPLTLDGKLVGLVNFGVPCAFGFPDAYARVSYFHEWVRTTVAENSS